MTKTQTTFISFWDKGKIIKEFKTKDDFLFFVKNDVNKNSAVCGSCSVDLNPMALDISQRVSELSLEEIFNACVYIFANKGDK